MSLTNPGDKALKSSENYSVNSLVKNVYITRTAVCLPNKPVENDQIESILGMVGGKPSRTKNIVLRNNGIVKRYYVLDPVSREPVYTNAQLTAEAVRNLFPVLSEMNDIDCLVSGTTIADQIMPNHAVMVHGELKIPPCEVIATSGVCLSSITALKYAFMAVKSGEHNKVVSTGSEAVSIHLRANNYEEESRYNTDDLKKNPVIAFEKDFLRWLLSDGAGAFLLEPEPTSKEISLKINWLEIISFANEIETCMYAAAVKEENGDLKGWGRHEGHELLENSVFTIKQDVKLLNEHIIDYTVTRALTEVIQRTAITADKVDHFLPHVSSMYFYNKVHDALCEMDFEIPQEKWFTNLKTKGNTGSAALYIMLDEFLKTGNLKTGETILCYIPESGRFSSAFLLLTAE